MARSRSFEKSRKSDREVCDILHRRRSYEAAMSWDVQRAMIGQHHKPEPRSSRVFAPFKQIFLDEPNLLIEIRPESAHVMPAR